MWFEDLTPYGYLRQSGASSVPTLNVGWLEEGRLFRSGVLPDAAVERLGQLVEFAATNATRGMHFCDLCPAVDGDSRACGHAEIRVVGDDGTRYAAPTLIHHYVAVHGYQPPQPFLEALMRAADLRWEVARQRDLCLSCAAPLRRTGIDKGLVRIIDGKREPVLAVAFDCDACGTSYSRSCLDENPLPEGAVQSTEFHACTAAPFVFAKTMGSNRYTEDRTDVTEHGGVLLVVVADGAGGMRGGSTASEALVDAVRSRLAKSIDPYDIRAWSELFNETDAALARVLGGETTAVLVVIGEHGVVGVSAGDSEAWLVSATAIDRLTEGQSRQRIGSGRSSATPFHRRSLEGTLVVGTDGLFKYVDAASISAACGASVIDAADRLAGLPRLASGAYPDDVAAVLVAFAPVG